MALTTWSRIEPHAQTTDIEVGLAAEIADPLWLLARQRQLGEFTGDDGGSPIGIHFRVSWSRLTQFAAGPWPDGAAALAGAPYDPRSMPLEPLVERETAIPVPADAGRAWGDRVRLGRRLEQDLEGEDAVIAALRTAFPFAAAPGAPAGGPVEQRYEALLAGKVLDGVALREAVESQGGPPPDAIAAANDPAAVRAAFASWKQWADGVAPGPAGRGPASVSWIPERQEYAFSVAAPGMGDNGEIVLEARSYDGTGIDWYSADVRSGATLGAAADAGPDAQGAVQRRVLPQPIAYPGMPADRFWEMEDGLVNLGAPGAGPTDLARMLAVEYALVYGPDWLLAPVELPAGSLARVDWVVVRDTFGTVTIVGTAATQAADSAGRQFQPSTTVNDVADLPLLFVPPSTGSSLRSRPLERLLLQRDEAREPGLGHRANRARTERPAGRSARRGRHRAAPGALRPHAQGRSHLAPGDRGAPGVAPARASEPGNG